MANSPGALFRQALAHERPLQIVGTINAYCALLAQQAGFQAIYLSGAGVANASYGMPDLALTGLNDVLTDIRRITYASELPLIVDADTGWGSAFMIARTVKEMSRAGAAGLHLEDQVQAKRCGHRPGKKLVSTKEMSDRIKAACDGRDDDSFFIIARTDAHAVEGPEAAIERANAYLAAGADGIFAEALTSPDAFAAFTKHVKAPVLANMTEFGKTPLMTTDQLAQAGVQMVLYPLSAFRAMSRAAESVYQTLRQEKIQTNCLESMQTREQLYHVLDYHRYEDTLDRLFSEGESHE